MAKQNEKKVSAFDVMKHLANSNGKIKMVPLDKIKSIKNTVTGSIVEIVIDPQTATELMNEKHNGGLFLMPNSAYEAAKQMLTEKIKKDATDTQ